MGAGGGQGCIRRGRGEGGGGGLQGGGGGFGLEPPHPRVPLWSPLLKSSWRQRRRSKNFGCQPQTLEGEEGGGSKGGGTPPPPTVYGRSNASLGGGGSARRRGHRNKGGRYPKSEVCWLPRGGGGQGQQVGAPKTVAPNGLRFLIPGEAESIRSGTPAVPSVVVRTTP